MATFGGKQKEWLREGFRDQQQMTALEMLFKDTLTPAETKRVKGMDIEMASIIDERLASVIRRTDRQRPRDAARVIVHNEVYGLPEASYPDEVMSNCIIEIIEYFYERDLAA